MELNTWRDGPHISRQCERRCNAADQGSVVPHENHTGVYMCGAQDCFVHRFFKPFKIAFRNANPMREIGGYFHGRSRLTVPVHSQNPMMLLCVSCDYRIAFHCCIQVVFKVPAKTAAITFSRNTSTGMFSWPHRVQRIFICMLKALAFNKSFLQGITSGNKSKWCDYRQAI